MRVQLDFLRYDPTNGISFSGVTSTRETSPEEVQRMFTREPYSVAECHQNPHITAVKRIHDKVVVIFSSDRILSTVVRKTYEGTPQEMAYLYNLADIWTAADMFLSYEG